MAAPNGQYGAIVCSRRGVIKDTRKRESQDRKFNRMKRDRGFVTVAACLLLSEVVAAQDLPPTALLADLSLLFPTTSLTAAFPPIAGPRAIQAVPPAFS
jgi:hypothetical protein